MQTLLLALICYGVTCAGYSSGLGWLYRRPRLEGRTLLYSLEHQTVNEAPNENDTERKYILEKYQKRTKRRSEMPLSQKWYKAKQRHMTKNQKRALHSLWPVFGIDLKYNTTLKLSDYLEPQFSDKNYVTLDIGFGRGESLYFMASQGNEYSKFRNDFEREGGSGGTGDSGGSGGSELQHLFLGCEIHKSG